MHGIYTIQLITSYIFVNFSDFPRKLGVLHIILKQIIWKSQISNFQISNLCNYNLNIKTNTFHDILYNIIMKSNTYNNYPNYYISVIILTCSCNQQYMCRMCQNNHLSEQIIIREKKSRKKYFS